MEVNVLFEEGSEKFLEADWLEKVAEQVLITQGVGGEVELSLVITGQEQVRRLNSSYLGKDEPTDVLSFAMIPEKPEEDTFVAPPDGIKHLGEVIISYPQAAIQAKEKKHPVKWEIAILIIHGVLHLLGYDHDKPGPRRKMRAKEKEILSGIEGCLV